MTTFSVPSAGGSSQTAAGLGSKDGLASGDHDQAYTFGRRPRAVAPFPFTDRQFGRLLALRGRISDGLCGGDDLDAAGLALESQPPDRPNVSPTLCYTCQECGAMVPGAHQSAPEVNCPRCAHDSDRHHAASAILRTAGVLMAED
jgi:hypothetical protein